MFNFMLFGARIRFPFPYNALYPYQMVVLCHVVLC